VGAGPRAYDRLVTIHPQIQKLLADARVEDLRRTADRERLRGVARAERRSDERPDVAITIRLARPDDCRALLELAQLDSAEVPASPVLIAEANGRLRAAVSLHDGATIADPFQYTEPVRQLLSTRAAQVGSERRSRRRERWPVLAGSRLLGGRIRA
jgi:hypothetical protein